LRKKTHLSFSRYPRFKHWTISSIYNFKKYIKSSPEWNAGSSRT